MEKSAETAAVEHFCFDGGRCQGIPDPGEERTGGDPGRLQPESGDPVLRGAAKEDYPVHSPELAAEDTDFSEKRVHYLFAERALQGARVVCEKRRDPLFRPGFA